MNGPNQNMPSRTQMPLGLMMELEKNPSAKMEFGNLTQSEQEQLIHYIQGSDSGRDARLRISHSIDQLQGGPRFF